MNNNSNRTLKINLNLKNANKVEPEDYGGSWSGQNLANLLCQENYCDCATQGNNFVSSPSIPDYVLIWTAESQAVQSCESDMTKREVFEYNLEEEGLYLEFDQCNELNVVKIWAPVEVLMTYSETLQIRVPFQGLQEGTFPLEDAKTTPNLIERKCKTCKKKYKLDPEVFPKRSKTFTYVYIRDKEYLFDQSADMYNYFPPIVRSRVVLHILRETPYRLGAELCDDDVYAYGIEQLVYEKVYDAGFALHDGTLTDDASESRRKLLYDYWAKLPKCCKEQPIDTIKDYYGEEFAIYFAWLGFYSRMLLIASLIGFCAFLYGFLTSSSDLYVNDICNKFAGTPMCPKCYSTPIWELGGACDYANMAHVMDNDLILLYAFLMSFWAVAFLAFWKRRLAQLSYAWDLGFLLKKENLTPRPDFTEGLRRIYGAELRREMKRMRPNEGLVKQKLVALLEIKIPFWRKRLPNGIVRYSTYLLMVAVSFAALLAVLSFRMWLICHLAAKGMKEKRESVTVSVFGGILNFVLIALLGLLYEKIARQLTEKEYPRTQSDFETSNCAKTFVLLAINRYSAIIYLAFFKGSFISHPQKYERLLGDLHMEQCDVSCLPDLCIQVTIVSLGMELVRAITKFMIPWVIRIRKQAKKKKEKEKKAGNKGKAVPETEACVDQWMLDLDLIGCDGMCFLNQEYLEMALQFGLLVLFMAAFPLAPLLHLVLNAIRIRVTAWRLLKYHRKPVGRCVKGIGLWYKYIDGLVKVAVLSNALVLGVSSNFVPKFLYRFNITGTSVPHEFGTLEGYLNSTLTSYKAADVDTKASGNQSADICYFQTHRYDHTTQDQSLKYESTSDQFRIWVGRAVFVILYASVIGFMLLVINWMVPSVPKKLHTKARVHDLMLVESIEDINVDRGKRYLEIRHLRPTNLPGAEIAG